MNNLVVTRACKAGEVISRSCYLNKWWFYKILLLGAADGGGV